MTDEIIKKKAITLRKKIINANLRLKELQVHCLHRERRACGWNIEWETGRGALRVQCSFCGLMLDTYDFTDLRLPDKSPFPDRIDIIATIARSSKVDAIRLHRELCSALLDAKRAVEEVIGWPHFT